MGKSRYIQAQEHLAKKLEGLKELEERGDVGDRKTAELLKKRYNASKEKLKAFVENQRAEKEAKQAERQVTQEFKNGGNIPKYIDGKEGNYNLGDPNYWATQFPNQATAMAYLKDYQEKQGNKGMIGNEAAGAIMKAVMSGQLARGGKNEYIPDVDLADMGTGNENEALANEVNPLLPQMNVENPTAMGLPNQDLGPNYRMRNKLPGEDEDYYTQTGTTPDERKLAGIPDYAERRPVTPLSTSPYNMPQMPATPPNTISSPAGEFYRRLGIERGGLKLAGADNQYDDYMETWKGSNQLLPTMYPTDGGGATDPDIPEELIRKQLKDYIPDIAGLPSGADALGDEDTPVAENPAAQAATTAGDKQRQADALYKTLTTGNELPTQGGLQRMPMRGMANDETIPESMKRDVTPIDTSYTPKEGFDYNKLAQTAANLAQPIYSMLQKPESVGETKNPRRSKVGQLLDEYRSRVRKPEQFDDRTYYREAAKARNQAIAAAGMAPSAQSARMAADFAQRGYGEAAVKGLMAKNQAKMGEDKRIAQMLYPTIAMEQQIGSQEQAEQLRAAQEKLGAESTQTDVTAQGLSTLSNLADTRALDASTAAMNKQQMEYLRLNYPEAFAAINDDKIV